MSARPATCPRERARALIGAMSVVGVRRQHDDDELRLVREAIDAALAPPVRTGADDARAQLRRLATEYGEPTTLETPDERRVA